MGDATGCPANIHIVLSLSLIGPFCSGYETAMWPGESWTPPLTSEIDPDLSKHSLQANLTFQ